MKKSQLRVVVGLAVPLWAAACSGPPTELIDATRTRLEAVASDGETYAAQAYRAARDAGQRLEAELKAQNDKVAVLRSYSKVRELAESAQFAADHVEQVARTEKERLSAETSQMVADGQRALAAAKQALETVPPRQKAALAADVTSAETALTDVAALLSSGKIAEAHHQVEPAVEAAKSVNAAIEEAKATARRAEQARRTVQNTVRIPRAVLADGKLLSPGTSVVRPTGQGAAPAAGEAPGSERWVEFGP